MVDLDKYTKFHSPGYVIEIYKSGEEQELVFGNAVVEPEIKACNKDTLYDIASLTKVYTATLIYIAFEEKVLDIYESVYNIDCRFKNLTNVKIIDLLSHNQEIWTDGYLGDAKSKDEFYNILFSAYVKSEFPTYVDTHYIILSTILEKIYNQSFEQILKKKILTKLGLEKTTVYPIGDNIASSNYVSLEGKIIDDIVPGLIHDAKGRKAKNLGIITGHASIFTTGRELLKFLITFLDNKLLKQNTIGIMLLHRKTNLENYEILKEIVPESDINTMYEKALKLNPSLKVMRTYNNMGTRYYNDIHVLNDIPDVCSKNTITFSGFTGPSFIIDFEKKVIVIVMCNVLHNTKLNRFERKHTTDLIIEEICNEIYNKDKC